jgi:hypothetical protein
MSKGTKFGKSYAETIRSRTGKSTEDKVARQKACVDYEAAKNEHKKTEQDRAKKLKEEQEELARTKDDRAVAKKEKKLAKNKARRERQIKAKAVEVPSAEVVPQATQVEGEQKQ